MPLVPLPIDPHVPKVLEAFKNQKNLVLKASPGSGKTTRIPPALLKSALLSPPQEILVLEPRRLAAKLACLRVVEEEGVKLGEEIGYHFRNEKRTGPKTRLTFLTEGLLIRRALQDPTLKNVGLIVLDEFHERHLQTDVALSYLKFLQDGRRPDLKLLVMSATLDTQNLQNFLKGASVIEVEAPPHPLSVQYQASDSYLDKAVVRTMKDLRSNASLRHTLVFLPGMREIRRAGEALQQSGFRNVFALHGELSKEEQERALSKSPENKIILTTNIAESSVTIDGVNAVVDSGLERVASISPWTGLSILNTKPTSKASCIQRAGRAARQGPGLAIRLYSEHDFETRASFALPEIRRADLSQTFLELKGLGIKDLENFPWFEKPSANQFKASTDLLNEMGALENNEVTPLGKRMASLPLHPRLSKLVLDSEKEGCTAQAVRLAALLSEGELESLDALRDVAHPPSFRVKSTEERLFNQVSSGKSSIENLPICVLHAFPDRVGRRRLENKKASKFLEIVMASGGTVLVEETPFVLSQEFFVVLDAQETKRPGSNLAQNFARSLVGIDEASLLDVPGDLLKEEDALSWDAKLEEVVAKRQLKYGQLVLEEKSVPAPPSEAATLVFLREGLGIKKEEVTWDDLIKGLCRFAERETLESTFNRILFLAAFKKWKVRDPKEVVQSIGESWSTRKALDWEEFLKSALLPEHSHLIDRLAPTHFDLHKKRRAKINYASDKTPWIESRLQDFFGVKTNPAILDGAVPLVLHLQAPNQRAVQVTQDLKGFWERHYPALRQELSRRYPRHQWPENPLTPVEK